MQDIADAETAGYDVLILDSLSHEWAGTGGVLQIVDEATAQSSNKNAFTSGWSVGGPLHNQLMDRINSSTIHIIATMRVKMEYAMEKDRRGKSVPVKVGLAPVQRDTTEYEFDIMGVMDNAHTLTISGTRCVFVPGATGPF